MHLLFVFQWAMNSEQFTLYCTSKQMLREALPVCTFITAAVQMDCQAAGIMAKEECKITVYRKKNLLGGNKEAGDKIFSQFQLNYKRVMRSLPMQQTAGFICIIPIRPLFPSGCLSTHDEANTHTHPHDTTFHYISTYIFICLTSADPLESRYTVSVMWFQSFSVTNSKLFKALIYLIFIKQTNCLGREGDEMI